MLGRAETLDEVEWVVDKQSCLEGNSWLLDALLDCIKSVIVMLIITIYFTDTWTYQSLSCPLHHNYMFL